MRDRIFKAFDWACTTIGEVITPWFLVFFPMAFIIGFLISTGSDDKE